MSYKAEDFRNDTPPRITRSMSSYTSGLFSPRLDIQDGLPPDLETYHDDFDSSSRQTLWLGNGGVVSFVKNNNVIEYFTPEVNSAKELLTHERVGEDIVSMVGAQAVQAASSDAAHKSRSINKRAGYGLVKINGEQVLAPMGIGHFENYVTSLHLAADNGGYESPDRRALNAFLASRIVLSGTGMMSSLGFEISQKAHDVNFYSSSLSGNGIKRTYNSVKVANGLSELEIKLGEGNMSDWAITNKYALTSLVLRLIEHGQFPENLLLPKSTATTAMRRISRQQSIETVNHTMTGATHLRLILEAALEFANHHEFIPEEEIRAAVEGIDICKNIDAYQETGDDTLLPADRVDWAAKQVFMKGRGFAKAVEIDLSWEDVSRPDSISRKWYQRKNQLDQTVDSDREAATQLPPTTRALARTSLLALQPTSPTHISWAGIQYGEFIYRMRDPSNPEVPSQPQQVRRQ